MQKARRHPEGLRPLVSVWFQVLFTPLFRVLFTFPSQYWFTIGLSVVFSLGGWSPHIQTGFHVSRPTRYNTFSGFTYRIITFFDQAFQLVRLPSMHFRATPFSLAATLGISIDFFSSGYLDVSVPRVSAFRQLFFK